MIEFSYFINFENYYLLADVGRNQIAAASRGRGEELLDLIDFFCGTRNVGFGYTEESSFN